MAMDMFQARQILASHRRPDEPSIYSREVTADALELTIKMLDAEHDLLEDAAALIRSVTAGDPRAVEWVDRYLVHDIARLPEDGTDDMIEGLAKDLDAVETVALVHTNKGSALIARALVASGRVNLAGLVERMAADARMHERLSADKRDVLGAMRDESVREELADRLALLEPIRTWLAAGDQSMVVTMGSVAGDPDMIVVRRRPV